MDTLTPVDDRPICLCGSGKLFLECHGAFDPPALVPATPPRILTSPTVTRKLDLACGQRPKDGFEGVDIWEKAQHVVNLMRFPWPFEDSSVIELECSHFAEHLPAIDVDAAGNMVSPGTPGAKDLFFAFFDECYRILAPGGWMHVVVPCLRSNRAFQDPTHRRFYPMESFFYLSRFWREQNKLDHYNVACNFDGNVVPTVFMEMNTRASEVVQQKFQESWNVILDWDVILLTMKGMDLQKAPTDGSALTALREEMTRRANQANATQK